MDRTMGVHPRPPLHGNKFPHLFASMLAPSFVLMFGEKFSTLSLSTFAKKLLSRLVQSACRKLPGRHRRVF
jgi:uncharacterized membrane protein YjjP (DUF1212 family)